MKWIVLDCRTRDTLGLVEAPNEEGALLLGKHYESRITAIQVVLADQYAERSGMLQPAEPALPEPDVHEAVALLRQLHLRYMESVFSEEIERVLALLGEKL